MEDPATTVRRLSKDRPEARAFSGHAQNDTLWERKGRSMMGSFSQILNGESYGHDLETGAPLTKDHYRASCSERLLTTSPRLAFLIKSTLRSVQLAGRCIIFTIGQELGDPRNCRMQPQHPLVEMNEEDAAKFNVKDGENPGARGRSVCGDAVWSGLLVGGGR